MGVIGHSARFRPCQRSLKRNLLNLKKGTGNGDGPDPVQAGLTPVEQGHCESNMDYILLDPWIPQTGLENVTA